MNIRLDRAILLTAIAGLLLLLALTAIKVNAQAPVCRPFVYESSIGGVPPINSTVTFEIFEDGALRERTGTIYAYYYLPCWPGEAVFGLEEIAYVIDYGEVAPAGNRVDIILNRDRFEVVA